MTFDIAAPAPPPGPALLAELARNGGERLARAEGVPDVAVGDTRFRLYRDRETDRPVLHLHARGDGRHVATLTWRVPGEGWTAEGAGQAGQVGAVRADLAAAVAAAWFADDLLGTPMPDVDDRVDPPRRPATLEDMARFWPHVPRERLAEIFAELSERGDVEMTVGPIE